VSDSIRILSLVDLVEQLQIWHIIFYMFNLKLNLSN
jgi:hypothetical protein